MAINYPLNMPTNVKPRVVSFGASSAVSLSRSPFTFAQQVQQFDGDSWRVSVSLPPMERADAEQWIAFLLKLKGQRGTFYIGDDSVSSTLGSALPDTTRNLLTESQDFDDADWTKNGCTVTANATTAPDGTTTADHLVENSDVANNHYLRQYFSITSGVQYIISLYAKADGSGRHVFIGPYKASVLSTGIRVDLSDGSTYSISGFDSTSVEDVGSGWWRIEGTFTAPSTDSNIQHLIYIMNGASFSYNGDGTSGVYIWGTQLRIVGDSDDYRKTEEAAITPSSPQVDGASQTGSSLNLTGFLPSQTDILKAGDLFELDSYLYKVLNDVDSDANGDVTVDIFPSLRSSPADGTLIVTDSPKGIFRLASSDITTHTVDERKVYGISFTAIEAI